MQGGLATQQTADCFARSSHLTILGSVKPWAIPAKQAAPVTLSSGLFNHIIEAVACVQNAPFREKEACCGSPKEARQERGSGRPPVLVLKGVAEMTDEEAPITFSGLPKSSKAI